MRVASLARASSIEALEETRPDLLAPVARRDQRPEEVGVCEAARQLDAAEADDPAVLLLDQEHVVRPGIPVGDLTLQLRPVRPQRVADLLVRAGQSAA